MNKKAKIAIVVATCILLGLIVVIVYLSLPSNNKTLKIKDKNNHEVVVPDFKNTAVLDYQDVPVLVSNDQYNIQYDTKNNVFQIFLNVVDVSDIPAYRTAAENALAQKLNKTATELCALNVTEAVPDNGTLNLKAYNFGLSNCTN